MKAKGYLRYVIYVILMVIFATFSYILIYSGLNTKTKNYVDYQKDNEVLYKVYLHDNDIYDSKYLKMGDKYISELVDYIDFEFNYKSLYDSNISGYYSYGAVAKLVAYEDDINDSLWIKEYDILEDTVEVVNTNNTKSVDISKNIKIDYDKYKNELDKFINSYGIDVSGYLEITFNVMENLDFQDIDKNINEDDIIRAIIPLTYKTFRVNVMDNESINDSYYDFTNRTTINYVFLVLGIISLVVTMIFLILIIKELVIVCKRENKYVFELEKILSNHDDKIVNVKRFYNNKKYNLIYVDSFKELIDVYNKIKSPISFREVKKNYEAIFVIIEEDNAWIYRMFAKNMK